MEATDLMIEAPRKMTLQQRAADELRTLGESLHLQPVRAGETGRADLEAYVRTRFAAKHGAEVRTFMPTLISFRDRQGELRGVAGIRGAEESRLYLEHYLDRPVEERLTASLRRCRSIAAVRAPSVATRSSKSATSPAPVAAPRCAWSRSCQCS